MKLKKKNIILAISLFVLLFIVVTNNDELNPEFLNLDKKSAEIVEDTEINSIDTRFVLSQGNETPPEIPSHLKYSTSLHSYNRIQVDNELKLAFIAGRYDGFIIMNLTNVESPDFILEFDDNGNITNEEGPVDGGEVKDVIVADNYAYLQVGSYGLMILDISDMKNPAVVYRYNPDNNGIWGGRSLHLFENILYFSLSDSFDMLDVTDPTHPIVIETGCCGGFHFTQYNDYLITVCYPGIGIFEIQRDNTLNLVSTIEDSFPNYLDFHIAEDLLYVSAGSIGVRVYNLTNIENPQFLFDFHTDCEFVEEVFVDHTLQGDVIYVADREGSSIYYYHRVNSPLLFFKNSLYSRSINAMGNLVLFGAYSLNIYELDINKDTDGDGMFDLWEYSHNLNFTYYDANDDLDNDTLTNIEEFALGTFPEFSDTDGDGYTDYEEFEANTDPNDPDDYPKFNIPGFPLVIFIQMSFIGIILATKIYGKFRKV